MKIVIIGGTGHIGTYLAPRLVRHGHEVFSLSRGEQKPYTVSGEWDNVRQIRIDRAAEEEAGRFGARIRELGADVVVDLICFTPESAQHLVDALDGHVQQFLHCGTLWVYGASEAVPTDESAPRRPFGEYGVQKAAIEQLLLDRARRSGFPAVILHPGHIVGPGWAPVNPAGNWNPDVFRKLAAGEDLPLPDLGLATVHHVHADDVAQAFERSIYNWSASVGESFHVVSPQALTLRGFAEAVARWFGREAVLSYHHWERWQTLVSKADASGTWDHIAHSPCASIRKARERIGYEPRYSSLEAVRESLSWLIAQELVHAPPL